MTEQLRKAISEEINKPHFVEIARSEEFYFQKATDTFEEFKNYKLSDLQKYFLKNNKKKYDVLKEAFDSNIEYKDFGEILFRLIAYCDSKAYRKNELNHYNDKRVLALAFVRMNNWIEQLLAYKIENISLSGSIKNAIDYLIDPINNFTMLSENHRNLVTENLFGKEYNNESFKDDFISFFDEFSFEMKNNRNYTYYLCEIVYSFSNEWKDEVIGLLVGDGTGWLEEAISDVNKSRHYRTVWNHKRPNGTDNTLKLLRNCLDEKGLIRIFYSSNKNVKYIAEIIDFVTSQEELSKADWGSKYLGIVWDGETFGDYIDESGKSASIIFLAKKIYKVADIPHTNFSYYNDYKYPSVGSMTPVKSYKTNFELKEEMEKDNIKDLLKYKKQIILQGPPGTGKTRLAKRIASDIVKGNHLSFNNIKVKKLTVDFIKSNLEVGDKIESKNNKEFEILALEDKVVILKSSTSKPWRPSYNKVIHSFENELWRIKGRTGGYKPYEDAIAKHLYDYHLEEIEEEIENRDKEVDFIKLIQFHPSYTYEDFVRGIVTKPNEDGDGIDYQAENKILGELAEKAFLDSSNDYVLIIDEINRANLSSVLGELIYAVEYRGKDVESMYAVDGENKLVLPSNLYIIGTMNTADRSVGHIDYAIRRRFAFVDVLPEVLSDNDEIYFNIEGFDKISKLFTKENVSSEFQVENVQIGHSYFLIKKDEMQDSSNLIERDEVFKMKMEYEVLPILKEYVKDGVLIGEFEGKEIESYIDDLIK